MTARSLVLRMSSRGLDVLLGVEGWPESIIAVECVGEDLFDVNVSYDDRICPESDLIDSARHCMTLAKVDEQIEAQP